MREAAISQLRRGALEFCVLALLRDTERYAYEIVHALSLADGLGTTQGTLYPLLSRLRKHGVVDTSDDPRLARWQDRLLPLNVRIAHGCHCNRHTVDAISVAGFDVTQISHDTIKHVPPFIRPLVVGIAQAGA